MYRLLALFAFWILVANTAFASPLAQSGDSRWIVFASRQAEDEAIGVARAYRYQFPSIRVVQSTNGWFAIIAGPERVPNPRQRREQLLQNGDLPKDILFSRGDGYVREVWTVRQAQPSLYSLSKVQCQSAGKLASSASRSAVALPVVSMSRNCHSRSPAQILSVLR